MSIKKWEKVVMKLMMYTLGIGIAVGLLLSFSSTQQQQNSAAVDCYIYAYPLVLMEVTKNLMVQQSSDIRINQFTHISEFPTASFKDIVRPNIDTLYSFAWLDLSVEPIILSVPDTHGRYYLMELMDAWTNVFASLGKRTTGTKAQHFVIVGPGWQGTIPEGIERISSPTNMVFILGRTQTNGKKDYGAVHAIQAGYVLKPLSTWAKQSAPLPRFMASALASRTGPMEYVDGLDAQKFYEIFAQALEKNPPAPADKPMLTALKSFGIEAGKEFQKDTLSASVLVELNQAIAKAGKKMIVLQNSLKPIQGWIIMMNIGTYGADYLTRAMIARIGIGANLPEDAVYPTAFVDDEGRPLSGNNTYVIHFDADKLPPVNAFWSITLYNEQGFLVANNLNRYGLGDRDKLAYNGDGSLDMYVQHESPGSGKESNWLPAPAGKFNLTMRLYWPQEAILNGAWTPPAVRKY
jgi:hypothetical protein